MGISKALRMFVHSSVAISAFSLNERSTGVVCVWNPVIALGLPAWPTMSTACKVNCKKHLSHSDCYGNGLQVLVEGDQKLCSNCSREVVKQKG